jgi:hypothetical protein
MAILTKGQTFANGNDITSTKLNNLVDNAAFVGGSSGTTDDSSLEVNGSGRLQVKDLGVSTAKIANGSVTTAKLPASTSASDGVTYAKIQQVADMKLLGNTSGALAAPSEVSILDEDTMVSDSAIAVPTQQSVKAYVDSNPRYISATAVSASGSSIDFTGIPSWARRITIMFENLSTNGTSHLLFQIGTSSGVETTGYNGIYSYLGGAVYAITNGIAGFYEDSATDSIMGTITLNKLTGNTWISNGSASWITRAFLHLANGRKTLSNTLDRVRITTAGGVNTFDAGTVNITYE